MGETRILQQSGKEEFFNGEQLDSDMQKNDVGHLPHTIYKNNNNNNNSKQTK